MRLLNFGPDVVLPIMIFTIPIIAIIGGITAGIARMLGQQRLIELAQRERLAAIERGIDPSKLPPLPNTSGLGDPFLSPDEQVHKRSQMLLIGGVITLAIGIGVGAFLKLVSSPSAANGNVWAVGLVPSMAGLAMILCSFLVRPKN